MSVDCQHRDTHRHREIGALDPALGVSVLDGVAAWVVGCSDDNDPQQPVAVWDIPELTLYVDSTESVNIAGVLQRPWRRCPHVRSHHVGRRGGDGVRVGERGHGERRLGGYRHSEGDRD